MSTYFRPGPLMRGLGALTCVLFLSCGGVNVVPGVEICNNGVDDDGDSAIDCLDLNCTEPEPDPACSGGAEICTGGADEDGDGAVDCEDSNCAQEPTCTTGELCDNILDDNGNGLTDCADADCAADPICVNPEVCDNGVDDNGNGAADCADNQCAADPACVEICDDTLDNDLDGAADCADAGCLGDPACSQAGTGVCADPFIAEPNTTSNGDTSLGADNNASAGNGGCFLGLDQPEEVYAFTAPADGAVSFSLTSTLADLGFYTRVASAIDPSQCSDSFNEVECVDFAVGGGTETGGGTIGAGVVVHIFVDGCEQNCVDAAGGAVSAGPYTLTVNFQ